MEMRVQVPFKQLLTMVKNLTPAQKAKLRQELDEQMTLKKADENFIEFLLNGPVYSEKDIKRIEENRKYKAAWRTKS